MELMTRQEYRTFLLLDGWTLIDEPYDREWFEKGKAIISRYDPPTGGVCYMFTPYRKVENIRKICSDIEILEEVLEMMIMWKKESPGVP